MTRTSRFCSDACWSRRCAADEGADTTAEAPTVQYASETQIDFEGLDVTAEIQAPDGRVVFERRAAEFAPMIRLRTDFNEEVAVSVDLIN